jgi:hypothetical protein
MISAVQPRPRPARLLDLHRLDVGSERVATHRELVAAGVSTSAISRRIAPGGRWQRLHPGVVLMHRGCPTWRERAIGALALAGPGAVLTGATALRVYGFRTCPPGADVLVLMPASRRRQGHGGVLLERTSRLPEPVMRQGLPVVPLARAVVDACRRLENVSHARDIVAEAIQHHRLSIAALAEALRAAARQRTASLRRVLAEIHAGVRSAAEARAREVMQAHGLPEPLWNAELVSCEGIVVAKPDALWLQWLAALEINSRRWHLSPGDFEYTQNRQGFLVRQGVIVMPVTPARILEDEEGFVQDVRGLLRTAQNRRVPAGWTARSRNA